MQRHQLDIGIIIIRMQQPHGTRLSLSFSSTKPLPAVRCFSNNHRKQSSVKGVYGQSPNLLLETGQPAIDFTLYDFPDGNAWSLRKQLEGEGAGKPVVLIWGMYTCPAFQGMGDKPAIPPWDMCGYRDEYDLVRNVFFLGGGHLCGCRGVFVVSRKGWPRSVRWIGSCWVTGKTHRGVR